MKELLEYLKENMSKHIPEDFSNWVPEPMRSSGDRWTYFAPHTIDGGDGNPARVMLACGCAPDGLDEQHIFTVTDSIDSPRDPYDPSSETFPLGTVDVILFGEGEKKGPNDFVVIVRTPEMPEWKEIGRLSEWSRPAVENR